MKYVVALALLACMLCACGRRPADSSQASNLPPARIDLRAAMRAHPAAPLLQQLELDIAALQTQRRAPFGSRALAAAGDAARAQARWVDASMYAAAGVSPPSVRISYPAQYRDALAQRNARALALARQQYGEKEAEVAYDVERAHSGERVELQLQLRTLYLSAQSRRRLLAKLAAIDAQTRAAVTAQRQTDEAALARYREQLIVASNSAEDAMAADVRARPAKAANVAIPHVNLAQAVQTADLSAQDIQARFALLRRTDTSDARDAATESARLSAECDRLRAEMRADIEARAAVVARTQGLGTVYVRNAPANARDITPALLRALARSRNPYMP